jgi:hypothetical protein
MKGFEILIAIFYLFVGRALVQAIAWQNEIACKLGRAFRYKSTTSSAFATLVCGLFTAIPHANLPK